MQVDSTSNMSGHLWSPRSILLNRRVQIFCGLSVLALLLLSLFRFNNFVIYSTTFTYHKIYADRYVASSDGDIEYPWVGDIERRESFESYYFRWLAQISQALGLGIKNQILLLPYIFVPLSCFLIFLFNRKLGLGPMSSLFSTCITYFLGAFFVVEDSFSHRFLSGFILTPLFLIAFLSIGRPRTNGSVVPLIFASSAILCFIALSHKLVASIVIQVLAMLFVVNLLKGRRIEAKNAFLVTAVAICMILFCIFDQVEEVLSSALSHSAKSPYYNAWGFWTLGAFGVPLLMNPIPAFTSPISTFPMMCVLFLTAKVGMKSPDLDSSRQDLWEKYRSMATAFTLLTIAVYFTPLGPLFSLVQTPGSISISYRFGYFGPVLMAPAFVVGVIALIARVSHRIEASDFGKPLRSLPAKWLGGALVILPTVGIVCFWPLKATASHLFEPSPLIISEVDIDRLDSLGLLRGKSVLTDPVSGYYLPLMGAQGYYLRSSIDPWIDMSPRAELAMQVFESELSTADRRRLLSKMKIDQILISRKYWTGSRDCEREMFKYSFCSNATSAEIAKIVADFPVRYLTTGIAVFDVRGS